MTHPTAVEHALAVGTPVRCGAYRLDLTTGAWWWSDQVYAIHGFAPHEVVPTTELLLAHKHPGDRDRVACTLDPGTGPGEPFSCVHRICDASGHERLVGVVGETQGGPDGAAVAVGGYVTELTGVVDDHAQAAATASIAAAAQSRAVIDQACGAVALAGRTDPRTAFHRLRVASNDANVPVRTLATAIVTSLPELGGEPGRLVGFLDALLAPTHRAA
ncbi:PAS and ANTAR domain-containing protein [Cellulomonas olei]|uniref:PAS and ANTAR domain-containing protein n=1 Tax=Cellulomonas sp. P4 TaxID=3142533 RepID=UPI0031BBC750